MQITINIPANDCQKATLLKLLAEENDMVLSQAYLYAKNLCDYGVDIAVKWSTVTSQAEALERAYRKGRYDEMERWQNIRREVYKESENKS